MKEKINIKNIVQNANIFIYQNYYYICDTHPAVKWAVLDLIEKKLSAVNIFRTIIDLIKPPFIVKSTRVPKKLRKKTKNLFTTKLAYVSNDKRIKNSYKQLLYYNHHFTGRKFKARLYKAIMFSLLDWKNSYLFKIKTRIFKKFFKV